MSLAALDHQRSHGCRQQLCHILSVHNPPAHHIIHPPITPPLLLRSRGIVRLGLRPLLPRPLVALLAPGVAQPPVRSLLALAHLADLDLAVHAGLGDDVPDRHGGRGATDDLGRLAVRGLDLLGRRVGLLVGAGTSGEEDQSRAVGLEPGDVLSEGFGREVLSAGVDGDADRWGEFARDAGFLDPARDVSSAIEV